MKYITVVMGIVLLIAVYSSVIFSDKFAVLGHGYPQEKVTDITGVPTQTWELLNHPERLNYDLSSLKTSNIFFLKR